MKLHEYQSKEILKKHGIVVPEGFAAGNPEEACQIAQKLGGDRFMVKAQIKAGGRGKAGGIISCKTADDVREAASRIIGMKIVSAQTGTEGKIVHKVLVEKKIDIAKELYLGILVDRSMEKCLIMASSQGGIDIEETARTKPSQIIKEYIDPTVGCLPFQLRNLAYAIGISGDHVSKFVKVASLFYNTFMENDCSLLEINPLVVTTSGDFVALDAKIITDDNALFRHKHLLSLQDKKDENWREAEAGKHGLNYIGLDGQIGCLVNGAGLALATMDIIKRHGAKPANFLDIGGGADLKAITAGFKIILSDPKVKAILVNVFGGIVRCDLVAESIVLAAKDVGIHIPLVVRLEGTNSESGREILERSGLSIVSAGGMDEAAAKAVKLI